MTVHDAIVDLLTRQGAAFRQVHHPPTFTSEESAKARGEDVKIGGKALVVKAGDVFVLLVLSAARKLDSARVRDRFQVRKTRFADRDELMRLTGLAPGSVPPFGRPVLPLDLYADPSTTANDKIAFNAGSLTDSIVMSTADWVRIAAPTMFEFAEPG